MLGLEGNSRDCAAHSCPSTYEHRWIQKSFVCSLSQCQSVRAMTRRDIHSRCTRRGGGVSSSTNNVCESESLCLPLAAPLRECARLSPISPTSWRWLPSAIILVAVKVAASPVADKRSLRVMLQQVFWYLFKNTPQNVIVASQNRLFKVTALESPLSLRAAHASTERPPHACCCTMRR